MFKGKGAFLIGLILVVMLGFVMFNHTYHYVVYDSLNFINLIMFAVVSLGGFTYFSYLIKKEKQESQN